MTAAPVDSTAAVRAGAMARVTAQKAAGTPGERAWCVRALGATIGVRVTRLDAASVAMVRGWSEALAGAAESRDADIHAACASGAEIEPQATFTARHARALAGRLSVRVTLAALTARADHLLLLHAGAIADRRTGWSDSCCSTATRRWGVRARVSSRLISPHASPISCRRSAGFRGGL